MTETLTYIIICIMIYICIYAIVERICKSKEQCAVYQAMGMYFAAMAGKEDVNYKMSDILDNLKKAGKED